MEFDELVGIQVQIYQSLHVLEDGKLPEIVVAKVKSDQFRQVEVNIFDVTVRGIDGFQIFILVQNVNIADHVSAKLNIS